MRLLARLEKLQQERGFLQDDDLRALASDARVPLHRIQELVSFYPHFRATPPPRCEIALCRDVACQLAEGKAVGEQVRRRWQGEKDIEIPVVSCLGRCDHAPAALVNGTPVAARAVAEADDVDHLPSIA